MQLLDGKAVAASIKNDLKQEAENLRNRYGKTPHLAVIIVGNNPASETYVNAKIKACKETGFDSTLLHFNEELSEKRLLEEIQKLNEEDKIDGILVQLPLPRHISENRVILQIDPSKDVDGFHPITQGKMLMSQSSFLPATPYGILLLLNHYGIETAGKHCVIVGRSHIVGTPMAVLMSRSSQLGNATVTICHSHTKDLSHFTKQADILIAAIGKPKFITVDMIKEEAIIIDVGINRIQDQSRKSGYRLVGDVDFEMVSQKASWITPVPKGVGPMTICGLLKNTLQAAQLRSLNAVATS